MKINLLDYQQEALDITSTMNRVAYYLDMGLGKTFVGSEKMRILGADQNLIVCQKSKVDDWIDHMETYYPSMHIVDGTKIKHLDIYDRQMCVVINYDLLYRRDWIHSLRDFTLMLDESSMIKNHKAKRTKSIMNLPFKNIILLSGTPIGGKYEELWTQCRLLGWNISMKEFLSRYVIFKYLDIGRNFDIPIVIGYKNEEELIAKIHEMGAIFKKSEEVLDLTEQKHIIEWIPKSRYYKKYMKDGLVVIDDEVLVNEHSFTNLLISRELCGSYCDDKIVKFKDIVESTSDRLIVFYNFNMELSKMLKVIGDRPYSLINGKTKEITNYERCNNAITFVQYQSGAMGLNLQKANKVIYFTLPLSSELFEQSKKRIHRIGQTRPCFYYYLLCKDTVEENILKTLKERKDYTDRLFKEDLKC